MANFTCCDKRDDVACGKLERTVRNCYFVAALDTYDDKVISVVASEISDRLTVENISFGNLDLNERGQKVYRTLVF